MARDKDRFVTVNRKLQNPKEKPNSAAAGQGRLKIKLKKQIKLRDGLEDMSRSNSRQYDYTTALDQHLNLFKADEKATFT